MLLLLESSLSQKSVFSPALMFSNIDSSVKASLSNFLAETCAKEFASKVLPRSNIGSSKRVVKISISLSRNASENSDHEVVIMVELLLFPALNFLRCALSIFSHISFAFLSASAKRAHLSNPSKTFLPLVFASTATSASQLCMAEETLSFDCGTVLLSRALIDSCHNSSSLVASETPEN